MTKRRSWTGLVALASLVAACSPTVGGPPPPLSPASAEGAKQRWPDATPESLEQGRKTFLAKCSACHGYPALAAHSDAEWGPIVDDMGKKAKLDDAAREQVLRFVLASRTAQAR